MAAARIGVELMVIMADGSERVGVLRRDGNWYSPDGSRMNTPVVWLDTTPTKVWRDLIRAGVEAGVVMETADGPRFR